LISSKESLGERTAKTTQCSESIEDTMVPHSSTETDLKGSDGIKLRRQLNKISNIASDPLLVNPMYMLRFSLPTLYTDNYSVLSISDETTDSSAAELMCKSPTISVQSMDIDVMLQSFI